MKNTILKSLILALAIAIAIGSVLFFVRYVVSPPEDISAEATAKDVFNPNLKDVVSAYNPDSLSLKDAEIKFDALIDRANIFIDDKLISDKKVYDNVIIESSEKFAKSFVAWSFRKFSMSIWNNSDHETMLRVIAKMRKVSIEEGAKKALSPSTLSTLTEIESVIKDYNYAWSVTKLIKFTSYQNVVAIRKTASTYATKKYLSNCTNLVDALNAVGEKQERSCFSKLSGKVKRLKSLSSFDDRDEYNAESKRIYGLIKEFKETNVFGVSTAKHAETLAEMQDAYDNNADNYSWPDEE